LHIPGKTERERDRANKVADDLDAKDQGKEEGIFESRPEVKDVIFEALGFDAVVVVPSEDGQTDREIGTHVVGRRSKARNHPQEVACEDEEEDGGKEGEVVNSLFPKEALKEEEEAFDRHLKDVAEGKASVGDERIGRRFIGTMEVKGESDEKKGDQSGSSDVEKLFVEPKKSSEDREVIGTCGKKKRVHPPFTP